MTAKLRRPIVGVTLRGNGVAVIAAEDVRMDAGGSTFTLRIRRPLARLSGEPLAPGELPVALPILGRQQVANAAVAATVALVAGARPDAIAAALARAEPMRRRMQIVHRDGPLVLDDTVGNPESIDAVFDAIRNISRGRLRVAYAIRGSRGPTINERNAAALAEALAVQPATLVVTASEDVADARNQVTDDEREAVLGALRATGTPFAYEASLGQAVEQTLDGCHPSDLVLLLGAQGMDQGARLSLERLRVAVSGPAATPGARR
jgi:UDP-N-acetylmuramoyl-L-alanyl-D-glutamate--2,6-diaminopimelate ligase